MPSSSNMGSLLLIVPVILGLVFCFFGAQILKRKAGRKTPLEILTAIVGAYIAAFCWPSVFLTIRARLSHGYPIKSEVIPIIIGAAVLALIGFFVQHVITLRSALKKREKGNTQAQAARTANPASAPVKSSMLSDTPAKKFGNIDKITPPGQSDLPPLKREGSGNNICYCDKCGSKMQEEDLFCTVCGTKRVN